MENIEDQITQAMKNANQLLKELKEENNGLKSDLFAFPEWIQIVGFKKYEKGWCIEGGSNGWHCTTEELYNRFKELPQTK